MQMGSPGAGGVEEYLRDNFKFLNQLDVERGKCNSTPLRRVSLSPRWRVDIRRHVRLDPNGLPWIAIHCPTASYIKLLDRR
jgi:hypothetical protein